MSKVNMILKRMTVLTLSATLALTAAPVAVFADDDASDEHKIVANDEKVKEELGDVAVESEGAAVDVYATNGYTAEVSTGSIENSAPGGDAPALRVNADKNGTDEVYVDGNISAKNSGICASSETGGTVLVDMEGNITTGDNPDDIDTGILVNDGGLGSGVSGGTTIISLKGNINSEDWAIQSQVENGGRTVINVTGDLTSDFLAIDTLTLNGTNDINIDGSIYGSVGSETGVWGPVLVWTPGKNGQTTVRVSGDITNENGIGMVIGARDLDPDQTKKPLMSHDEKQVDQDNRFWEGKEGGKNNVVVEGTIKGKNYGIVVDANSTTDPGVISVWKIERNENGAVAATSKLDDQNNPIYTESEELEKNIQYIIKCRQPNSGGSFTLTDENGDALGVVEGLTDTYQWAHEDDKILVKINLDNDYELNGVYGDEGQKLKLTKDASGNYYLVVPRGGGVFFTIDVNKVKEESHSSSDSDPATNSKAAVAVAGVTINPLDNYLAQTGKSVDLITRMTIYSIIGAPLSGTISMNTGRIVDPTIVHFMLHRTDLTYILSFDLGNEHFVMTIPSNSDISHHVNKDGELDLAKLIFDFPNTKEARKQ